VPRSRPLRGRIGNIGQTMDPKLLGMAPLSCRSFAPPRAWCAQSPSRPTARPGGDQRILQLLADRPEEAGALLDERRARNSLTDREQQLVQQLFHRSGVRTRSQLVRVALEGSLGAAQELMRRP